MKNKNSIIYPIYEFFTLYAWNDFKELNFGIQKQLSLYEPVSGKVDYIF